MNNADWAPVGTELYDSQITYYELYRSVYGGRPSNVLEMTEAELDAGIRSLSAEVERQLEDERLDRLWMDELDFRHSVEMKF